MKKLFCFFIITVMLFSLFGCKTGVKKPQNSIYFPSKSDVAGTMEASMKGYKDTKELYNDSDHVIIGIVTESDKSANKSENVPTAMAKVKVEKVLKGTYAAGDEVNVHETGERTDKGDIAIDGVPLLKKDMKVLLFLNEGTDYYIGELSFGIRGVNLGKFFYDAEGMIHSSLDFTDDVVIKLEDFTEPMTEDQFIYLISDTVS